MVTLMKQLNVVQINAQDVERVAMFAHQKGI